MTGERKAYEEVICLNKKVIGGIVAVLIIVGLGWVLLNNTHVGSTSSNSSMTTPTPTIQQATQSSVSAASSHTVSYKGQDGKTALDLLKEKYPDTQATAAGMVTAINGYTADDAKHEYWKFQINGADAQVGAGSYTTKSTDTITWSIATY